MMQIHLNEVIEQGVDEMNATTQQTPAHSRGAQRRRILTTGAGRSGGLDRVAVVCGRFARSAGLDMAIGRNDSPFLK
jgi:hypothetical protein